MMALFNIYWSALVGFLFFYYYKLRPCHMFLSLCGEHMSAGLTTAARAVLYVRSWGDPFASVAAAH
jgi:hypothetical protein